ncbi:DUF2135 domain-containing protein [Accumulibacter sp.]|uniref:YfaP family protein n=1 Tax=Accumulibacter sp. TaxID=2053492 RepID=UPI0025883754|nr:DUF2135 domain-containing protein [Accumulibacter sp.]
MSPLSSRRSLALCALLAVVAAADAQISLDAPRGGWKHSGGESAQHLQDVHYPASRVNAGGPRSSDDGSELGAAIRGRIAGAVVAKARPPQLLVVNGVAMPLSVTPDGFFARPYAFPPGANSVEVRSADRRQVRRVNFYDANPTRQRVGLRVVLSWDSDMTDIDLHVVSPDGQHVFFGERIAKNGGALDVDVTGGYGPEIYAIPSPPHGNWQIYVNYFGAGMGAYGEAERQEITIAQVAIITREGTPDEKLQVFRVPLRRPGELTLVKSFVYP